MPPSPATLREQKYAEVAYLIFIDGLPTAYATDHDGNGLLGSGAGSWIGFFESGQTWENLGQREVRPGLLLPSQLPKGDLDVKSGMLRTTSATFQLVDFDGSIARLFATKGKGGRRLAQHLPAGQDDLVGTLGVEGGGTIAPANKHLSTEAIGPNGERRAYHCFPFRGFGFEYHYPINQTDDFPRPPLITDEPVDFAGRWVTVWRVHKDTRATSGTEMSKWTQWADLDLGPDLVWVGKMRDSGTYRGDKVWSFTCDGVESLLKKQCGALTPREWMQVSDTSIELTNEERRIALEFRFYLAGPDRPPNYEGDHYDSISFSESLPATGSRHEYIAAISAIVHDVKSGVTAEYGGAAFTSQNLQNFVCTESGFSIVRCPETSTESVGRGVSIAEIAFHNKVWRILGFEPEAQSYDGSTLTSEKQIRMFPLDSGDHLSNLSNETGGTLGCPADGYWYALLDTVPLDMASNDAYAGASGSDNGGAARTYRPQHDEEGTKVLILNRGTTFKVSGQNLFCPDDPLVVYETASAIEGDPCNRSRYFVFKGKRAAVTDEQLASGDFEGVKESEFGGVARCSWPNGTTEGEVGGLNGNEFVLEAWVDPRPFGLDHDKLSSSEEWAAIAGSDKFKIECAPLNALSYYRNSGSTPQLELVWLTLRSLLVSTGTVGGYSGGISDGVEPTFTQGNNGTIGTDLFFGGDVLSSDVGLGIPEQLVMSLEEIEQAFAEVPDGEDAYNGFMRGRYAYRGAFDSYKVIESIARTRGLMLTWKGGQLGVGYLGDFDPADAETTITEDDLHGQVGDPSSVEVDQELRATGPIDKLILSYRHDVTSGKPAEELEIVAKDEGSRRRKGDLEEEIKDDGLVPVSWYVQAGKNPPPAWQSKFDRVWAVRKARWLAERHFSVRCNVMRRKGQHLGIGSKVRFTNPWLAMPDGTYGCTDARAVVTQVTFVPGRPNSTEGEHYEVELLVFAEQFDETRYFMPIGEIADVSGTSVTLVEDAFGAGTGIADAARFIRPSQPSNLTGDLEVRILEWDRVSYTLGSQERQVLSRSGNVLTINSAFTNLNPYTRKWLVAVPYDDQTAGNWARTLGIVTLDADQTFGSGPTQGFPFLDE